MPNQKTDEYYMKLALDLAKKALSIGEVPIGALIVARGEIVGEGYNQRETGRDATLHAEMIAIRQACATMGGWRLPDATIYVTLEPCPMCAGAILNARIDRLVFGAADTKSGAAGGRLDILNSGACNYVTEVHSCILSSECSTLLKEFFNLRRHSALK